MIIANWEEIKTLIDSGTVEYRHIELSTKYVIHISDENFVAECVVYKDSDDGDVYEASYKAAGELSNKPVNADTGGFNYTPKFAPEGWYQQRFETEFETSTYNSVHEKDADNNDIGWSVLKFYKADGAGGEILCTDQADATANCIRTDLEWMPNIDYMIKGGFVAQFESLDTDVYVWVQGGVLPEVYGIPPMTFTEGGINMRYVDAKNATGLDGVAGTVLYYTHPQLGSGQGTNKLRFIIRHPVGHKHRLQCIFDIFRA